MSFCKCIAVIHSCLSQKQLLVCKKYLELYIKEPIYLTSTIEDYPFGMSSKLLVREYSKKVNQLKKNKC